MKFVFHNNSGFSLASAFVGVDRSAPDEESLVLLKPVVQFYFTYGVSRGFSTQLFNIAVCLLFITSRL